MSPFLLLMPSYNQLPYIREAVESVLSQDDPDWELWILDNSSDGTAEYLEGLRDPRIRAEHRPERMDPGTCLNGMLAQAKGEHFSFIHTDNRLLPGFVRRHRAALSRHPLALAYSDFHEIDDEGRRVKRHRRPDPYPPMRLFSSDSLGVPFAATTALAEKVGGFPAGDLADDVYFALVADAFGPRIHLPEPLVEYRTHGHSRTEQAGMWSVRQAIHRTVVAVYARRDAGLPDPFRGGWPTVEAQVDRASRAARLLARHLLAKAGGPAHPWIDGTDPASFWLAWACAEAGHPPAGFLDRRESTLLGLPVVTERQGLLLRPRRRGISPSSLGPGPSLSFRWVAAGLDPEGRSLRRLTPEAMAVALVPFQAAHPPGEPVWIRGSGALAAWLAYGAERLGGLEVAGFLGSAPAFPGLPVRSDSPGSPAWVLPGNNGPGLAWGLRGTGPAPVR